MKRTPRALELVVFAVFVALLFFVVGCAPVPARPAELPPGYVIVKRAELEDVIEKANARGLALQACIQALQERPPSCS